MDKIKNKQSTKHLTSFYIITFHTLVVNKIITKDIFVGTTERRDIARMDLEKEVERLKFENEQYQERIKELNNLLETKEKNDRDIAINNKKFDTIQKAIGWILVSVVLIVYFYAYFNSKYIADNYIDNTKASNINNNIVKSEGLEDLEITNEIKGGLD